MPGRSSLRDPLKAFRYRVEVPGFQRTGFSFVSGLKKTTEVIDYREGGMNESPRRSPGLTTYEPVTLRRGAVIDPNSQGDLDLYIWAIQVSSVKTEGYNDFDFRRDITIALLGRGGSDTSAGGGRRWDVVECWPSEYQAFTDLGGLTNEDVVEEVVLQNEGHESEDGPAPPTPGGTLSAGLGI